MDGEQDLEDVEAFLELSGLELPCVGVSARTGRNLHQLLETLYRESGVIRADTKAPGKEPDRAGCGIG